MPAGMNLGRRASFLLPLSLVGCRKTASPVAAAEAFLDAYYLERDHARALKLCADAAEVRVRREQELRAEAGGDYGVQPSVHYKQKSAKEAEAGGQELSYEVSIDSAGVRFRKTVLLRVRRYGEDWKVSNFVERDESDGSDGREEARP